MRALVDAEKQAGARGIVLTRLSLAVGVNGSLYPRQTSSCQRRMRLRLLDRRDQRRLVHFDQLDHRYADQRHQYRHRSGKPKRQPVDRHQRHQHAAASAMVKIGATTGTTGLVTLSTTNANPASWTIGAISSSAKAGPGPSTFPTVLR